jgi:hypothetical protein
MQRKERVPGVSLKAMNPLRKLLDALRPTPTDPDELAAEAEARRIRDQMETVKLSQRSGSGENYQSGRGSL